MGRRKQLSTLAFPLILVAFAALGGIFGPHIPVADAATEAASVDQAALGREMEAFTKVYTLLDQNAAEKLNPDKAIYKGAIPGMLRTLDPHSNFFDPRDYQALREEQKGSYFGVGMHVAQRGGKTVVIAPFPGSPAYKAGMHPGDIIVAV